MATSKFSVAMISLLFRLKDKSSLILNFSEIAGVSSIWFWKDKGSFVKGSHEPVLPNVVLLVPWRFLSGRCCFFGKKIQIFSNNFMFRRVCSGICCLVLKMDGLILIDWQVFMWSCGFRILEAMMLGDMEVPQNTTRRDSCFLLVPISSGKPQL